MITTVIVASPMAALTRCLPILLLVAMTVTTGASEDRANFCETKCYAPPTFTTADGDSTCCGNLLQALPSAAAAPMGFASLQTARRAVSDSAPKPYRHCLWDAGKKITEQCGDASRRAGFLDDLCFPGCADGANSSSADANDDFRATFFSGDAVPRPPDIVSVQRLVALPHSLSPRPRAADGSVPTAEPTTPASKGGATAVHDQAQCVCCLRPATKVWGISAVEGSVTTVLRSRCYLRFDISTPPHLPLEEKISRCRAPFAATLTLLVVARSEGTVRWNLLEALPSAAEPTGFASFQTAAGRAFFERALVRGLCFDDSTSKPFRCCLSEDGNKITEQCGDARRRACFLDELCFLRYANGAISSSVGANDDFRAVFFSGDAVPGPDIVSVQRLVALPQPQPLSTRAADGLVPTAEATTIVVLTLCARDQAAGDCVGCLRPAAKVWGISAVERQVAAVPGSKCYLRFDISTCRLEEKISQGMHELSAGRMMKAVMIVLVVGALIFDQRTTKARNNRNAAAIGRCRGPFAAIMVALLVVARLEGTAAYGYTTHYFPQELDHFSFTPASSTVFYQRYLVNDSFWVRSHVDGEVAGPIFVYMGNESPVETFVDNTGLMFDIAPKFGALLVFIEHRYYGESLPFGNHSFESPEKLGYLTSTQALADYALLINSLKNNLSASDSPVVVFGGSYGGMLAAWFRLKYPHVAVGALAASAPVLMFDNITPWESFDDVVSQDYKSESLNCFSVIKQVWDVIYERGSTKKGLLELSKTFRACRTVPSARMFITWLEDAFKFTTIFDYPIPVKFLKNLPAYPVKEMCKIIDGFSGGEDVVQKVFAAASLYYNYTGTRRCFDIEHAGDPLGPVFQWQTCTEMILPMTSSNFSMFPPLEFSYQSRSDSCFRKFKVKPRPHWITAEFGGTKIEQVLKRFGSNIIFSNGLRDPVSRGGVLKNISSSIIALVAEKGAHHFDLRGATIDDPDWAVEQRMQEVEIMQGWIDQYYDDTA